MTKRLAVLDALRLVAVLMAALHLLAAYSPGATAAWGLVPQHAFGKISHVAAYGWLGWPLLFMISGFVAGAGSWDRTLGEFLRGRVVRLVPVLVVALPVTVAALAIWHVGHGPAPLTSLAADLTLVAKPFATDQTYGPAYWALRAEVLFSALFAFLIWRGLTRRRAVLFGYTWLLCAVLALSGNAGILKIVLQPEFAGFFVAGLACALIHRFGPDITLYGLLGLAFVLCQHFTLGRNSYLGAHSLHRTLSPWLTPAVITVWFLLLIAVAHHWTDGLRSRVLAAATAVVYPFSLLQGYLAWTLVHAVRDVQPRVLVLGEVTLVLLFAAWALHLIVERPLGSWLRTRLQQENAPEPAVSAVPVAP